MYNLWIPLLLSLTVGMCQGHGRLIDPPSRASAWRYGWDTPRDYNDMQGNCGGFWYQYGSNGGKCGICGDAWDLNPRPHEAGGEYATGTIVKEYTEGQVIQVKVEITANHRGHFEFRICPNNNPAVAASEACLDGYPLYLTDGRFKYEIPLHTGIFKVKLQLPEGLTCSQCVFQWRYVAGNSWGACEDGTGAVGCGNQEEFRACADVAIFPTRSRTSNRNANKLSKTKSLAVKVTTLAPEVTTTMTDPPQKTTTGRSPAPSMTTTKPQTPPPTTTGQPEPSPSTKPPRPSCHAVNVYQSVPGMDNWCMLNCLHVPPYCPASHCECD